jgi:hypothetical protein
MQTVIAYSIVAIALVYAAWLFMPQALRRWVIGVLIEAVPLSQRARFARLQSGAESVGCNTCKGCATDAPAASAVKTIRLHRR